MIVQLLRPEALIVLNIFLFVCVPVSGSVAKSTATSGKVASLDAQAKLRAPSRPAPSKADAEKAKLNAKPSKSAVFQNAESSQSLKAEPAKDSIARLIKNFESLTKDPKLSQPKAASSAKPLTVSTASSPVSASSPQAVSPVSSETTPSSANKANQQRRWLIICAMAQQPTGTPVGDETVRASSVDFGASLVPHGNDAETLPASAFN